MAINLQTKLAEAYPLLISDISQTLPTSSLLQLPYLKQENVQNLIIHHTAAPERAYKEIALDHINNRKFRSIAYHFGIDKSGVIKQLVSEFRKTSHAAKFNSNSLGVVIQGNYSNQDVPEWVYVALDVLILLLKTKFPKLKVLLHRDTKATECPGLKFDLTKLKNI